MAEHIKLKTPVKERPLTAWSTIAVEFLGSQTRFVKGERWTHRIVEKGDGPPLFMYHGVGGHVDTYARTLPALAKDFRVIAVDALYHGYSSKEPWDNKNRTKLQAAAYVDLLHALGYEKAVYEGESMGAGIGFEIGMSYPETVERLILNGAGNVKMNNPKEWKKQPWKGDLWDLSQKAVLDPTYENIRNRLLWLVHNDDSITDEMIAIRQRLYQDPVVNKSMRNVFNLNGEERPNQADSAYPEDEVRKRWKTPALVMYGEFNPMLGPDYGEAFANIIGAKFYEFKGAGHWPQWEMPDEYAAVMRTYLKDY